MQVSEVQTVYHSVAVLKGNLNRTILPAML
jgi:hypothetical protein